jgi:polyisoprenoid-binding protein YceI
MSTYQLDPSHSSINFSVKHMMIAKVHGGFEKMSGVLSYDAKNPTATTVEVNIEVASINTRDTGRDTHLKSADFFNAEKYPSITYKSIRVQEKKGDLTIVGELTIHGVTQPVTVELERPSEEMKDPWGNLKIGASGSAKVKRKDFGLTWNAALEAGGLLVGDDVNITVDVQFVKQV